MGATPVPHIIDQNWWVQQREDHKIQQELVQKLEVRYNTEAEPRHGILAFLNHKDIPISFIRIHVRHIIFFYFAWVAYILMFGWLGG